MINNKLYPIQYMKGIQMSTVYRKWKTGLLFSLQMD